MIYVPNKNDYACFVVRDSDTIRAYENMPTQDSLVNYRDYFINSNYLYKDGIETFSSSVPVCLDENELSTSFYYRNDLHNILIIFIIMFFIIIIIPYKIISRLFGRWFKV